jgi:hypothetical protein
MADDLNKNITIQVTADTADLEQSITNLNKIIDGLLAQQKQLDGSGQQNSATFDAISSKLEAFQKKLQDVSAQLNTNTTALNSLSTAAKSSDTALSSLTAQHQKTAKATGDTSAKAKELNTQLNSLNQAVKQQSGNADSASKSINSQAAQMGSSAANAQTLQGNIEQTSTSFMQQAASVEQSKTSFDAHAATMEHLKTSFDEVKDVSGIFGPSLQEAAKGFNLMKTGLSVMKDGLTGVGDTLKADGFDFLLQVLQMMFDYFVHTSTGTKVLQGAISAIGVVVNKVEGFFHSFMDTIINAFSHPMDTIRSLGKTVEENIINRFTAFATILDGLIHLDFKKVTDGAIQAATGVTHATDKISNVFTATVKGVKGTVKEMGSAYQKGTKMAAESEKHIKGHIDNVVSYTQKQIEQINAINKASSTAINTSAVQNTNTDTSKGFPEAKRPDPISVDGKIPELVAADPDKDKTSSSPPLISKENIEKQKKQEEERAKQKADAAKKRAQDQKDFEIQTAQQVSSATFSILQNSIKQQSEAKIAALEKDKDAELNNSSLTSAQKLAVQAKYKKQEDQVKAQAFKEEQEASIAQAVINGALAVTKATSQTGVLSAFAVPAIIAETAVEIAKIASQKPPAYAKGGLHYASDGRGGVLPGYSRTDNTNAYLRSGEGIVVSEAMRDPWARNLVSAINVGFGGRDFSTSNTGCGFAVGGIFTDGGDANRYYNQPVTDNKNLANSIAYQMVNNFPPVYVDVKDINNQQNILAQTINRVNL